MRRDATKRTQARTHARSPARSLIPSRQMNPLRGVKMSAHTPARPRLWPRARRVSNFRISTKYEVVIFRRRRWFTRACRPRPQDEVEAAAGGGDGGTRDAHAWRAGGRIDMQAGGYLFYCFCPARPAHSIPRCMNMRQIC